ncbi:uncharacterized protein LOC110116810 [Athalia rosae]|uniref:uncharacterized protein LOC110116810 n=1 Tax=Athalia rosae TaxID=37344 RepID=UPI00203486E4|nr:uncharacterized protein LOC110116810 [Athalia rosae]
MHPQNLEYAMPPPRRKSVHHHHRHHHHRRSRRCHRTHRRVASDPGTRVWINGQREWKRRRVFSFNNDVLGIRPVENGVIAEANEEETSPGEGPTSTFRKVPWHPNLHMLKIRHT